MIKIKKANEENKEDVIGWLKSDPVRKWWEVYDLIYEPNSTLYVACDENGSLRGTIVIVGSFASLDGEEIAAYELLSCVPKDTKRLVFPKKLSQLVGKKYPGRAIPTDYQMYLKKGEKHLLSSELAKKLSLEDAKSLAALYALVKPGELSWIAPYQSQESCEKLLKELKEWTVYGVFQGNELVAAVTIMRIKELPEIGLIASLFTHPEHRRQGYAKILISAATKDIFEDGQWATLYVRKTNTQAIRLYKKIGYRRAEEWLEVTTP